MGSCVALGMVASQARVCVALLAAASSAHACAACRSKPMLRTLLRPHSPPPLPQLWSYRLLRGWSKQHRRERQVAGAKKAA